MAQAGIHGMVGLAFQKGLPKRKWLLFGLLLGNLFPDTDNLAVAVATVMKLPIAGLHRTFTHSIFTVLLLFGVFYLVGKWTKQPRWINFGIGFSAGILLHILLDLLVWFNGVEILWPLPSWVNLWGGVSPPVWFDKLMMSAEFLFFAIFFWFLERLQSSTENPPVLLLRLWALIQTGLFVLFTILVYIMGQGFMTIYGLVYLLSLGLAWWITIKMRDILDEQVGFLGKNEEASAS